MGRAAAIWPESFLSYREGANVSDFNNASICSKVEIEIECPVPKKTKRRVREERNSGPRAKTKMENTGRGVLGVVTPCSWM